MRTLKQMTSLLSAAVMGMTVLSFTVSAEALPPITDPYDVVRAVKVYQAEYDVEIFTVDYLEDEDWVQIYWASASDRVSYEELVKEFMDENNIYYFNTIYDCTPDIPHPYTPPAPRYLLGDIDDDGTVQLEDAQLAVNAYAEALIGQDTGLTEIQRKAADPNGDGVLTAEDAQYILMYYAANTLAGSARSWIDIIIRDLA